MVDYLKIFYNFRPLLVVVFLWIIRISYRVTSDLKDLDDDESISHI